MNVVSIDREATAAPTGQTPSAAWLDRHARLAVTAQIHGALSYAQATGDVVCVHGPSGAGKTTALRHYAQTRGAVSYVAMSVAVRTPAGMLSRVAGALGAGGVHRSALAAEAACIAHLQDRNALLIVDEAQHLAPALLDELRCIRDAARCGLALAGDDQLWVSLAGSKRCDQIVGRIGGRIQLAAASAEDVIDLVAAVVGFRPAGAAADRVLEEARRPGGLHALRRVLAKAVLVARDEDRAIRNEDLAGPPSGAQTSARGAKSGTGRS